jgi:protein associated with RNAse G/E
VCAADIGRPIQIRGTSYDGAPHWLHQAYLVLERSGLIVTQTFAGTEVTTRNGPWTSQFDTRGHYWTNRWYNVIRLESARGGDSSTRPGRSLQGFYCNVATPAEFDGENLHYADLQLDVRVFVVENGGLRCEVWDDDEFEEARQRLKYPDSLVSAARAAVSELIRMVESRQFPFRA